MKIYCSTNSTRRFLPDRLLFCWQQLAQVVLPHMLLRRWIYLILCGEHFDAASARAKEKLHVAVDTSCVIRMSHDENLEVGVIGEELGNLLEGRIRFRLHI